MVNSLHLPKLAQMLHVILGPLGSRSQNEINLARDFLRTASVQENGEKARVQGRQKEPSDHDGAGLIPGKGEREEKKVGWISAHLREFGKAVRESSSQRRK